MQTRIEFESHLFTPFLLDECQVNPGSCGAELAFWLSRKLAENNCLTSYPEADDLGWNLEYAAASGAEFLISCRNAEGSTKRWSCQVQAISKGPFAWRKPSLEEAAELIICLKKVLTEESSINKTIWLEET
jgi:hypothetical protein